MAEGTRRPADQSYRIIHEPIERVDRDMQCPAMLQRSDGAVWPCTLTIRAGRLRHRSVHMWSEVSS